MRPLEMRMFGEWMKSAGSPEVLSSKKSLNTIMRKGDIIIASHSKNTHRAHKNPVAWASDAGFNAINKSLYGDSAHAAIYVGKGKAVEMQDQLQEVPIHKLVHGRDARIFRPKVPAAAREAAAKSALQMKKVLGDKAEYVDTKFLVKMLINDRTPSAFLHSANKQYSKNKLICSNMISKAYGGSVRFSDKKHMGFVTPRDLANSSRNKEIAVYRNKNRWDKKSRVV